MPAKPQRTHRPWHDWTPELDARLRAVYTAGRRGELKRLALDTGIPHNTLCNRALGNLGLRARRQRPQPPAWTPAEEAIVIEWGHLPCGALLARLAAAGFRRSAAAVHSKRNALRRAGAWIGADPLDYSVADIAAGLGCSPETVSRWIRRGDLKAKPLLPESAAGKYYRVPRAALRRFCVAHAAAVARAQPDLIWLIDLIACP